MLYSRNLKDGGFQIAVARNSIRNTVNEVLLKLGVSTPDHFGGRRQVHGLRGFGQRLRPRALRPRVFATVFLQGSLVLPLLPREDGAALRRLTGRDRPCAAAGPAFHVHDPQDAAPAFPISSRAHQGTLLHRRPLLRRVPGHQRQSR